MFSDYCLHLYGYFHNVLADMSSVLHPGNHLPLWDKVDIIDRAEHWRIRSLKESAHILGYNDLLSRLNIELNTIWGPIS